MVIASDFLILSILFCSRLRIFGFETSVTDCIKRRTIFFISIFTSCNPNNSYHIDQTTVEYIHIRA